MAKVAKSSGRGMRTKAPAKKARKPTPAKKSPRGGRERNLDTSRNPLFELGAAYYPDYVQPRQLTRTVSGELVDLGPEERIREDFRRMAQQGIHTIRMGEFSWSTVEPTPGELHFERFQLALDLAHEHGIQVIFCTPTATPPKWLVDRYPDVLPVTRAGTRIPFGSRRHYDFCHPGYQAESRRITEAFGRAFGGHPAVVGWQTDNEFGCHNSVFQFSEHCRREFRAWLKEKFEGDIGRLNEAWFTCFWSQGYRSFDEVELPFASWADQNPHLELDFRRFSNDMVKRFQREQCDILRGLSPGRYITHNLMSLFTDLCSWEASVDLDVAGFDHYQMEPEPNPLASSWQFAFMRSLKDRKFLVLEQQPVQVNWQPVNRRFSLDWLMLWGALSAFQGARGMYYFSWQRMYGGAEQYHDGIVPHDVRIPKSAQEKMIHAKNAAFHSLASDFGLSELPDVATDVLCIHNSESLWSHEITSQSADYRTHAELDALTKFCSSLGLGLHFAPSLAAAREKLSRFRLIVLPGYAFELTAEERELLEEFLKAGGTSLSFPRTGMKLPNNQMSPLPFALFGEGELFFDEYGALLSTEREQVRAGNVTFQGRTWAEKIVLQSPQWRPLARFQGGLYAGFPAVVERTGFGGAGRHVHLAFCPVMEKPLIEWLAKALKLDAPLQVVAPEGVQVIPLVQGSRRFLGAVNFAAKPAAVVVAGRRGMELRGTVWGVSADIELELRPFSVKMSAASTRCSIGPRQVMFLEMGGNHGKEDRVQS